MSSPTTVHPFYIKNCEEIFFVLFKCSLTSVVKSGYGGSLVGITGIAMSVNAGDKTEERLLDDCVSLSP